MTLVNVQSVAQVFQAQVELLTVSVTDDGEVGNILVTNSDNSTILVPFTASTTVQLTRDAIKTALEANIEVAARYNMANVSTDGVSMTQIALTGPFTAVGNNLGGSLAIVPTTTTPAAFATPRYKLDLLTPVAGSTGAIYVSRDTLRKCTGEYTLVANAVTDVSAPSLLVEDTNDLLAPAPGPFAANEHSGYMDNGLTTAKNGPQWVKEYILVKEQIELSSDRAVKRITDANYTVLNTDDAIIFKSTTSAGDHTVTFAAGKDGQLVTLMLEVKSGTDNLVVAGLDSGAITLSSVNHSLTAQYNSVDDSWRLVSKTVHIQTRSTVDTTGSVFGSDRVVNVSTTTSGGDYTLTFNASTDGAKVSVTMTAKSGTDNYILAGLEAAITLKAVNETVLVQYNLATDKWYIISTNVAGVTRVVDSSYTIVAQDRRIFLTATTSASDYTLTFAGGVDGQEVVVQSSTISGTDGFKTLGVEGEDTTAIFQIAGDSRTFVYDATADKWTSSASFRSFGVTHITDADYTVKNADSIVIYNSTTSAGNHTLTFGGGVDGQKVTVVLNLITGTDKVIISGVEDINQLLSLRGDCLVVMYDQTVDKWRTVSQLRIQPTVITDASYAVETEDVAIFCVSTGTTSDFTITFGGGRGGQKVTVVFAADGGDNFIIAGVEGSPGPLTAVGDYINVIYLGTTDKWYLMDNVIT